MGKIELSKRLQKASESINGNKPIVDIGSDHAYLPIYLIQNGFTHKAIAGEVVQGPYNNAKNKVEELNLSDSIEVRMGDGLDVLNETDEIGTIFICGMGGELISHILENGLERHKLPSTARLVLQPNNAEDRLRFYLMNKQYKIIHEDIIEENNKIYEIIVAEYQDEKVSYSEEELFFGPKLLEKKATAFIYKWQKRATKLKNILKQLEHSDNHETKELFTQKLKRIEKVIK